MSLLFIPIPNIISINKLPQELELIISHINSLDIEITKLLETNEDNFEDKLRQTEKSFSSCMAQIASAIALSKNPSNLIRQLSEIYSSGLIQIQEDISLEISQENTAAITLNNSLDIIRDYFTLIFNGNTKLYLPEYNPAFDAYVALSVCISSLMKIIKNKNKYTKNLSKLLQKCQDYAWKLESYVETIEIEIDPEQAKILERIKAGETQN
jgi:hypothetical protein